MTARADELLVAAAQEVFEAAAFVFAEPVSTPGPPSDRQQAALLDYAGALAGRLWLAVPDAFAVELAANLLGCEPDAPEAAPAAPAAVCELLNMIAGAFLLRWLPEGVAPTRGVPSGIVWEGGAPPPWPGEAAQSSLLADDGEQVIRLALLESSS